MMKSWWSWLGLVCVMVSVACLPACNNGGGDGGDPDVEAASDSDASDTSATTNDNTAATTSAATAVTAANTSLTGDWLFKHEVMRLQQSGASLQGAVYAGAADPADPVEVPVPVVGSVRSDGIVRMSELINYLNDPSRNYTIDKVGGLRDANTLVLQVTRGQTPQTQVWTRK